MDKSGQERFAYQTPPTYFSRRVVTQDTQPSWRPSQLYCTITALYFVFLLDPYLKHYWLNKQSVTHSQLATTSNEFMHEQVHSPHYRRWHTLYTLPTIKYWFTSLLIDRILEGQLVIFSKSLTSPPGLPRCAEFSKKFNESRGAGLISWSDVRMPRERYTIRRREFYTIQ